MRRTPAPLLFHFRFLFLTDCDPSLLHQGTSKGVFAHGDGSRYEGGFKDNLFGGEGIEAEDGKMNCMYRFEGHWKYCQRDGTGTYTFADGASWEGPWHANEPSEPGTWRFPGGLQVGGAGPGHNERHKRPAAPPKWWRAATEAVGGGGAGGSAAAAGGAGTITGDTVDGFGKKQYTCGSVYEVRLWFSRLRCFLFQS